MTENNAAQPGLTDDEILRAAINASDSLNITRVHEIGGPSRTIMDDSGLLELGRAIEYALLSKLRAEGVQAGDERVLFEADYAKAWNAAYDNTTNHTADDVAKLREGDGYGEDVGYLKGRWDGWKARAALASAPVAMIDTAKLAQLLDSVNGDCYLGKEKEEELVQSLRSQLRAPVADEPTKPRPSMCRIAGVSEDVLRRAAERHFKPPFDNCSFRMCDLPGQCRGEGKCHHPASAPVAGEAQPVRWLHTLHYETSDTSEIIDDSPDSPFGTPGVDYSDTYRVTSEPLYAAPQASEAVPEGYALVPVKETEAMHDAVMELLYVGVPRTRTQTLLDAYISAALKTQADKDGGDCAKGAGGADEPAYARRLREAAYWDRRKGDFTSVRRNDLMSLLRAAGMDRFAEDK
jgi:hypothetical protein